MHVSTASSGGGWWAGEAYLFPVKKDPHRVVVDTIPIIGISTNEQRWYSTYSVHVLYLFLFDFGSRLRTRKATPLRLEF